MADKDNSKRQQVSHRGPDKFSDLQIREPMRIAAGTEGVYQALKHSFNEMGVVRSIPALLKMNQMILTNFQF